MPGAPQRPGRAVGGVHSLTKYPLPSLFSFGACLLQKGWDRKELFFQGSACFSISRKSPPQQASSFSEPISYGSQAPRGMRQVRDALPRICAFFHQRNMQGHGIIHPPSQVSSFLELISSKREGTGEGCFAKALHILPSEKYVGPWQNTSVHTSTTFLTLAASLTRRLLLLSLTRRAAVAGVEKCPTSSRCCSPRQLPCERKLLILVVPPSLTS